MAEPWKFEAGKSVSDALVAEIAVISENLKIRRFAQMKEENGFITAYTHAGGKIVVLVDVETDVVNDAVVEMAKNVAMQAAAMRPKYNSRAEVDQDYIEKEKEVLLAAAKNEKPDANEKIWNGMVMGRINKELADICLQDQVYVKAEDGKQTVSKYIDQVAKANGAAIKVKGFIRFETGEGIEKKVENFAEEVAAQRR
jgi:elongation factor Ts